MQEIKIYNPICSGCAGSGQYKTGSGGAPGGTIPCPMCEGTGKQLLADLILDPGVDELLESVNQGIQENRESFIENVASLAAITIQNNKILAGVFPNGAIKAMRTFLIFEATVFTEFWTLPDQKKDLYRMIISMSIVNVAEGSKERNKLFNMFGPGTQTRANLEELFAE